MFAYRPSVILIKGNYENIANYIKKYVEEGTIMLSNINDQLLDHFH
jgi:hypothetical protein